jgi:hypothetical protein
MFRTTENAMWRSRVQGFRFPSSKHWDTTSAAPSRLMVASSIVPIGRADGIVGDVGDEDSQPAKNPLAITKTATGMRVPLVISSSFCMGQ